MSKTKRKRFDASEDTTRGKGDLLGEIIESMHMHANAFDHASHAAELQRRGIKIAASPGTAEVLAVGNARCTGYAVQREFKSCP